MTIKDLIQEADRKISEMKDPKGSRVSILDNLMEQIKQLPHPENEIAEELIIFAQHSCNEYSSSWIQDHHMTTWIAAAHYHPSTKYLVPVCKILECNSSWVWHEGLVEILYDIEDEQSIPSLEKALTYDFPFDPWRHLGVKILETLYVIGTPRALEIIKGFLRSSSPELRKTANILYRNK